MVPTQPPSVAVSYRGLSPHQACAGAVILLAGDHDIATVAALVETMARVIAIDEADVVVDLSGVRFMGAETAEVLVRARDYLRARSRSLELRSPSAGASRALERYGAADNVAAPRAHPAGGRTQRAAFRRGP